MRAKGLPDDDIVVEAAGGPVAAGYHREAKQGVFVCVALLLELAFHVW